MITRRSLFAAGGGALVLAGCATEQVTADGRFPIMSVLGIQPDVSDFRSALRRTGLDELLAGPGPFTVFAPTNEAFDALPAGTVDTLLKPENKDQLTKVLTCHVVAVNALSKAIGKMIKDDGGNHPVKTVGGCMLSAKMDGDKITLTDETGGVATVTIADVKQSNGVIHVIDKVLLPKA